MSKVSYEIVKNNDRLFFNDGTQYVLFDSGFLNGSVAVNGKIGPFNVGRMARSFFNSFINLTMEDGEKVSAVFNPMDGYNCLLKGDTLVITDEEIEVSDEDLFFPFAKKSHPFFNLTLPLLEGSVKGEKGLFFFDSGARMFMFCEPELASSEKIRSYTEWMALEGVYRELDVFKVQFEFPNGFKYEGEGAYVDVAQYRAAAEMLNIRGMLGIDIFNHCDMAILAKGEKKGIALIKR